MLVPHRLSLKTVTQDYWRSLRRFKSGGSGRDWGTTLVLLGLPLLVAALCTWTMFVFPAPVALLPAVALLSGVLLAAAGQIITLRARIADSLTLSSDVRVTSHIRETMSGVVLAAVAAFIDALTLGALAASTTEKDFIVQWWHVAISTVAMTMTMYLGLMFIITARRLYATYLEVFEGGSPLPKIQSSHRHAEFYEQNAITHYSDKR